MTDVGQTTESTPETGGTKSCVMCGLSLDNVKRQRDSTGRYWCVSCSKLDGRELKVAAGEEICPDCGSFVKETIVADEFERVCRPCAGVRETEQQQAAHRRTTVISRPEKRLMWNLRLLLGSAAVFICLLMVRYTLLRLKFDHRIDDWLNVIAIVLTMLGSAAILIAIRVRRIFRANDYDVLLRRVENTLVALTEREGSNTVVERTELVRRLAHRAVRRIEAAAGQGDTRADRITTRFDTNHQVPSLVDYLVDQRPGKADLVARNREIETLAYLARDWESASHFVKAVLLRIPNDLDGLSRQAMIYTATGEFDRAKKNFVRAFNIAKQRRDELAMADAFANLGVVHQLLGEIDDAHKYHNKALFMYKKLDGHDDREADCYGNIGFIHTRRGETEDAEKVFRKALAINNKIDRVEGVALDNGVLGLMVYNKPNGDLKEAERMLRRAVSLNNTIGRFGAVAAGYGNLGLVRAKKRDYKTARKNLQAALGIYQRLNRPAMVAKVQGMITQISKSAPPAG